MFLFHLDAGIRIEGSHSRELGDLIEQEWRSGHPGGGVVRRHVGTEPIPSTVWAAAALAGYVPEAERSRSSWQRRPWLPNSPTS